MRVALIFDNRNRNETTGFYCRRALGNIVELEHLLPDELASVKPALFDLYLLIDDGLDYPIPDSLRPRAAWAIDTHIDFMRSINRFGDADWLFAAQKQGTATLSSQLGRQVTWLPLACDPQRHYLMPGTKRIYDIGFVGNAVGQRRNALLDELRNNFSACWIGNAYHLEMTRRINEFRVAFNCSLASDLNMRIFETLACGTPLVTDYFEGNGLEELFELDRHLTCYTSPATLVEQVFALSGNPKRCQKLALCAMEHVLTHHTYAHRMRTLIGTVEADRPTSVNIRLPDKSPAYYDFDRSDVAEMVPIESKSILDVGCGGGRLGESLKKRQNCHVVGIEQSPDAANVARLRLDKVLTVSIDQADETLFQRFEFDCIIFADVLEHLRDPRAVLEKCRQWLSSTGSLVISVPNSQHHSVVRALANGNWTYEHAGLLDADHVRCFTRAELEKLLFRSGFEIQVIKPIWGPGHNAWQMAGRPSTIDLGQLVLKAENVQQSENFFVYQFLARSVPRVRPDYGLTSIVMCTWNQLAYTRQCVESILTKTDSPYELIFVDNGSSDGTPDYLRSIPGAQVILNRANRGFAAAVNQGLQVASGKQVLLLNNDTLVTTGWLELLLEALYDRPDTGLVGPVSNNVSGIQQIPVDYGDLSCLDGFAWNLRLERELIEVDRLVGFCLLARREVLEKVGPLDERFEVGCFEDDDWCRRALAVGYKAYVASNAFVHHFGSVTFKAQGLDFSEIMNRNHRVYQQKWEEFAVAADGGERLILTNTYQTTQLASGDVLLRRVPVRLSLCMIVRDNEATIRDCLDSIYPWVDEIIVVDTGSVDTTIEICQTFGAQIHHFPWCDDFSAARNASLAPAIGDWIFWMDSDDIIPQTEGLKLRKLALGMHPTEILGYVMQVHCPSGHDTEMTIVDHVKLFRNRPDLRFEHRIHEQILPAIRAAGGKVEFTDIHVVHSGSRQTQETRQKKLERDFRILALDLQERPEHPFVLFNLGMTCEDAGDYEQAEKYLRRCIDVSHPTESQLRKAWALRVNCARSMGAPEVAVNLAQMALHEFPGDKELLFRRAMLYQELGRHREAINDYNEVLKPTLERVFLSMDPAICGYKARHNLALALQANGQTSEAVEQWQRVVNEKPFFSAAWLAMLRCQLDCNLTDQACQTLHRLPNSTACSTRVLAKMLILESQGKREKIASLLENMQWSDAWAAEELDEIARILTSISRFDLALPVLERLQVLRPDDSAVQFNLGASYNVCGNTANAIRCLENSLKIRGDHSQAGKLLANLYLAGGRPSVVLDVRKSADQINSHDANLDQSTFPSNELDDR
jgi:GT2 family glycosyltransferase/2-polyprenyl-3-methyl-5-hydroxy-6-metoxy-1,4-benzoquinol methylase/tetratricopeptide (TPR) repeat protein